MEDSWRPRPSQGNICPSCSISHYPYCPNPTSYDPSFHKPYSDPIANNPGITRSLFPFDVQSNSIRPVVGFPADVYNDQISRIRDGYGGSAFSESDRIVKRMRITAEDERRLSLIRDHGAPTSSVPPSQIGADTGYVGQGGNRLNGYSYESSYGSWQARPPGNGFYDARELREAIPDRGGELLHQESIFENREFGRREHDLGYGQQKIHGNVGDFQSDRNDMFNQNNERRGKDSVFTSPNEPELHPRYSQNGNATVRVPEYVNTSWMQQEGASNLHASDLNCKESRNMYRGNDSHHTLAKSFNQANEFLQTHVGNSSLSSGSGAPIFESSQSFLIHGKHNDVGRPFDVKHPPLGEFQMPVAPHNMAMVEQFHGPKVNQLGPYLPSTGDSMAYFGQVQGLTPRASGVYPPLPPLPPPSSMSIYPPLPPLPPPSLPMEPPGPPTAHLQARSSPPNIPLTSSDVLHLSDVGRQPFQPKSFSPDKPRIIDASSVFRRPNRVSRPDHIVVILRGLPGSGKSYIAKMLRDLEVENGAKAPRIHSMDDYFMTEVEKVEESLVKGKKRVTKKVMEYCYEPEMEETYRSSMLKAFKKTLEEGVFTFIIVDDRNLRVADFAQFWAIAKRSGYEVYLLEAVYKDPVGCAARNTHGFTSDEIQKMAELWEEAPSLYLRLDVQSLIHGDDLRENEIQEVDMDMDDVAYEEGQDELPKMKTPLKKVESPHENHPFDAKEEARWNTEGDDDHPKIKQLGTSKWSQDVDEDDIEQPPSTNKPLNALSGLIQAYTKGDKSVHWGDQPGSSNTGFSIGATKKANILSLVIGPGPGYNMKTNPLLEEENTGTADVSWQSKKRSVFEEQLRAERASERESFKNFVDRRRQRIKGIEMDDRV